MGSEKVSNLLIDVKLRYLCLADTSFEYFALSYVSGGHHSVMLRKETKVRVFAVGGIAGLDIPQAMLDAMIYVKSFNTAISGSMRSA
jgi:hypothetical protein